MQYSKSDNEVVEVVRMLKRKKLSSSVVGIAVRRARGYSSSFSPFLMGSSRFPRQSEGELFGKELVELGLFVGAAL